MHRATDRLLRVPVFLSVALVLATGCASTAQAPSAPRAVPDVADDLDTALEPVEHAPGANAEGREDERDLASRGTDSRPFASALESVQHEFVAAGAPAVKVPERVTDAPMGPGVTRRTITLADAYPKDLNEIFSSIGYEDGSAMTPREWGVATRAVADAINASGGILGRRLRWLVRYYNVSDYSTFEEQERSHCTYFTEEREVFAMRIGSEESTACIERRGGISLLGAFSSFDRQMYAQYPHAVAPGGISLDRHAALLVNGLYAQGFFESEDRIGLVTWGGAARFDRVVDRVLEPALESHGLTLTAQARIPELQGVSDIPRAQADVRREALRFKNLDIEKVIFLDNGEPSTHFIKAAEEQGYRPRFGFASLSGGAYERPANLLEGSMSVGWLPTQDLDVARGLRISPPATHRCRELLEAAGLEVYDTYWSAQQANTLCDHALFLKAAIEAGGPAITADSFIAGVESLGRSFESANVFATRFAPGRHDGVAAFRYVRWFGDCDCFRYTSPLYRAD